MREIRQKRKTNKEKWAKTEVCRGPRTSDLTAARRSGRGEFLRTSNSAPTKKETKKTAKILIISSLRASASSS